MKKSLVLVLVAALVIFIPLVGLAAELRGGESYTLGKGEIHAEDLYFAGESISISGEVQGDLISGAGIVFLGGTVTQDALIGGGNVSIVGTIGDDLRVAGGSVTLSGQVGGDVIVMGGQVHIVSGADIKGDLIALGGRVVVEGNVGGAVTAYGGKITLNNAVAENAKIRAQEVVLGAKTNIAGSLSYASPKVAAVLEGAVVGGTITHNQISLPGKQSTRRGLFAFFGVLFLLKLAMTLVAGLLGVVLFRKASRQLLDKTFSRFGSEFGRGLIAAIVIPFVTVVLFVSLVGIPLGVISLLLYILFMMVAGIYSGVALGVWLQKVVFKKDIYELTWKNAFAGIVIMAILQLIPLLGFIVCFIFTLAVFGTLFTFLERRVVHAVEHHD